MELLADRFAVVDSGRLVDLATGDAVALAMTSAGGPTEQARWTTRCDGLQSLRHRSMATLIDYGPVGEEGRFEAWRCGPRWAGGRAEAVRAIERGSAFLRACGLSPGNPTPDAIRTSPHGAVVLPDSAAGYPLDEAEKGPDAFEPLASFETCGFVVAERRPTRTLAELFQSSASVRPRVVAIWGAPGAGKSTVVLEVARVARLNGFVPVCTRLLAEEALLAELQGRRVFLIDDESSAGWAGLLSLSMRSPRPHVLLFVGPEEIRSVDSMGLDRMSPSALEACVRPVTLPNGVAGRVRRAAERAGGSPGRFVSLLWPDIGSPRSFERTTRRTPAIAAEQPAVYGADEVGPQPHAAPIAQAPAWPAPGELAALCSRVGAARHMIERGRHAPGERALRQAIGGLARRGDWAHAGEGALALASSLLRRGRTRIAQGALDEARDYWGKIEDTPSLITTATLTGTAWIDLARLDEAESVLGAALAAARAHADSVSPAPVLLALARCAFWAGRYSEGEGMLASVRPGSVPDHIAVRADVMASRLAIGLRDLERGVTRALEAVGRARTGGAQALVADALAGAAFAHLAVGDFDAVDRDLRECLASARMARDPLRRIRARLLLAEAARRRGRSAEADRWVQRLRQLAGASVPPIVAVRCALLQGLLAASARPREVVARHIAATGLNALALFASSDGCQAQAAGAVGPAVEDLVEILRVCQNAEEETALLAEVCARVRRQIRAAGVAFVAANGSSAVAIASDGGRIGSAVAERAMGAGIAIEPHRHEDRVEAAVPLRYGGAVIGALASRWSLGSADDLSGARAALSIAAAAAAPALAAAVAQRVRGAPAGVTDLRGGSEAMAGVRRAIERAARAPFAVLIEGQSGSGKELVARALHRSGPRRDRAFCTLNCAALPDELIEAELFGHARGAFTGAVADRPGVFEEAHGGTLFLDEVGELSPRAQAKLLRVLQEGELRRVGENVSRRVDVRVVAATNRDLRAEVEASRFRLDLLYRLDVIRIVVPPLRDRRDDIAVLAEHFWRETTARVGSRATLAVATTAALARYGWPGNVRELQNVLAALAVRSPKRGVVPAAALPPQFVERPGGGGWRLDEARRGFEERFVRAALARAGGRRGRAAAELGITRQGLTKIMARLGIGGD